MLYKHIKTKPTMVFMNLIKKKLLLKVDKSTVVSEVFKKCTYANNLIN